MARNRIRVPKQIKNLQHDSRHLKVTMIDMHTMVVESESNPALNHVVTVTFGANNTVKARCTCQWARHNGVACTHVMAALEHLAGLKDRTLSFWLDQAAARRQKQRTFRLVGGNADEGVWITSRGA